MKNYKRSIMLALSPLLCMIAAGAAPSETTFGTAALLASECSHSPLR